MTLSAPLITNVPDLVIIGKSPMKTSLVFGATPSLSLPTIKLIVALKGFEYVKSLILHSNGVYFASSKWHSTNSILISFEADAIGKMSLKTSSIPFSRNHLKESV